MKSFHPQMASLSPRLFVILLAVVCLLFAGQTTFAQDTVTGALEGVVSNKLTGLPIKDADVQITNESTGLTILLRTDSGGRFYEGQLAPGSYRIRVTAAGFQTKEIFQEVKISYTDPVIPVPVPLDPNPTSASPTATPASRDGDIRVEMNRIDARRRGSFTKDVPILPLGTNTLIRSFDELALLLPGVAPPPQTLGSVAGPGVGAGVGSAGQFAVNGLRSRANNFTVDGSDNNDDDIGVRRQGFVSLIPQPIDSIQEYHVTTLLAPAQFGRNIGAQVNAVSKSGGEQTHGTVYGFFNSSQLNARNVFDTETIANSLFALRTAGGQPVLIDNQPLTLGNESGGEDSFTLAKGGFVLGGPLKSKHLFYFLSGEYESLNATQEQSFAVPTLEQRGAFGTGATGLFRNPLNGSPTAAIPVDRTGTALLSLFPFPNHSDGVYGPNTFTKVLPAGGHGLVASGKLDGNFNAWGRPQSITARYNFTDDVRNIPVTGGALFSTLRPDIRTQNLSLFWNSKVTQPYSTNMIFNQVRLSYGRTRLRFDEVRDEEFLIPSGRFPGTPFLLNARQLFNVTMPSAPGIPNAGPARFINFPDTVEDTLGPIGQAVVAGFSPIGVDVFNFPQRRVNNTYQIADQLTLRFGKHNLTFGTDNRRTELNSELPRNARPLITFNGAPRLIFENGGSRFPTSADLNPVIGAVDLAAIGSPNNLFLTLSTDHDDAISLRLYQLSFYGQHDWRIRRNLSLSYGLRYEYNTPPRELNRRIEDTFTDPAINLVPGLDQFIDGRTRINDPDLNNFGPRFSLAYSSDRLGFNRQTILRAGYGLFYDQILGAVVSQSRNVFPSFLNLNFGGGLATSEFPLVIFNPANSIVSVNNTRFPVLTPGTLNQLNPELGVSNMIDFVNGRFANSIGPTLPARKLEMPTAHQFGVTFEQQLNQNLVISAAYVGTRANHLLRFSTPNLGPGLTLVPTSLLIVPEQFTLPEFFGRVVVPARPVPGVGAINIFETTATSRYDALQLQMHGRSGQSLQYQLSYTLSQATDDVSDVFDLAGAAALPQNSLTFAGERGPANFDARHRLTYNFIYTFADYDGRRIGWLLRGLQFAGIGRFQTGQPFTVNSTIDVNLDGNLTDRLNTLDGIEITGDRSQPLRLTTNNTLSLLAPFGEDGKITRNTFRAGNLLELDLAVIKNLRIDEARRVILRMDVFNFINRAN
ncbi:MAG TPA: TonB-dependent receptor, partial [Pyrinomonadaceae bacterium]|nr:TonB-dependent receptor [Pyrinomonadaceae bacterium]